MSVESRTQSIMNSWESDTCDQCQKKDLKGKCQAYGFRSDIFYIGYHFCSISCMEEKKAILNKKNPIIETMAYPCHIHGSLNHLISTYKSKHPNLGNNSLEKFELGLKIVEIYQKNIGDHS